MHWKLNISEERKVLLLSLVTGLACGLAAVALHTAVDLLRGCVGSLASRASWVNLIFPGLGMLLAMLFVRYVIKDDIGHGVTKVLLAISKNESHIKPHNTWSSALTSAVTIGFGGSVGAEAPIVYTGAAIGSNLGRISGMSYRNVTLLLGCGAAGAVAGIFKAPLAGVLFTLEILLFNISMASMLPLLISTISATVVSYIFLGQSPVFACSLSAFRMQNIVFYLILGIVCALFSIYFTRTTLWLEDRIKSVRSPYMRWLGAALGLGILIFLFPPLYGEGYDILNVLLSGGMPDFDTLLSFMLHSKWGIPAFFFLVLLLKVFSMSFTNAGGGVGGTFGPTLFAGAIAGFVMARTSNLLLAGTSFSVPEQNFVLVGMAGMMAGVMQAPMTAIFLIAEISGGYELLIPLIITACVSFGLSRAVEPYSIYTKRIAKSGELLTHDSDQAVLTLLKVKDFIETDFTCTAIDSTLGELVSSVSQSARNIYPVLDSSGRFQGYVALDDIREVMFKTDSYDSLHVFNFIHSAPAYIYDTDSMDEVMKKFENTGAWNLPVVDYKRKYLGFMSKSRFITSYREQLKQVSQE